MKHSFVALFACLLTATLLGGCSREDTISIGNPPDAAAEVSEDDAESETDSEDTETETDDEGEEESSVEGVNQQNVRLEVSNQKTAGQIKVAKVATSRDGWVSVHKSKEDGSIVVPDSIGEARVDSGDSEDVIVDLWEAPDVGEKLWVLLHIDAGERGKYEFPGEDQPVKRNGETMARSLVIQGDEDDEEDEEES